jgi:uncharacterized protein
VTLTLLVIAFASGGLVGVLAGLLGVGGGLIVVPLLAWLFTLSGFAADQIMHLALGSSLATIIFTSIASVYAHHQRGAVLWSLVARFTPGIVLGTLAVALIVQALGGKTLQVFFGLFELAVAVQMALSLRPNPHRQPLQFAAATLLGGTIGGISALVGVGGGTLTVPLLLWCNVTMQRAVATAAALGLPIAIGGSVGYLVAGWQAPDLPEGATGYLYWPAIVAIAASSLLTARWGAALAHRLPAARLKQLFAVILALIGLRMVLG